MNLLFGALKAVLFLSISVILALLTTIAALFGSALFPNRFFLPMSGSPRSDLWTDKERQKRLSEGVKNVSRWE